MINYPVPFLLGVLLVVSDSYITTAVWPLLSLLAFPLLEAQQPESLLMRSLQDLSKTFFQPYPSLSLEPWLLSLSSSELAP